MVYRHWYTKFLLFFISCVNLQDPKSKILLQLKCLPQISLMFADLIPIFFICANFRDLRAKMSPADFVNIRRSYLIFIFCSNLPDPRAKIPPADFADIRRSFLIFVFWANLPDPRAKIQCHYSLALNSLSLPSFVRILTTMEALK